MTSRRSKKRPPTEYAAGPFSGSLLVPLTRGHVAIIDEADLPLIRTHIWAYQSGGYAYRSEGPRGAVKAVLMHRYLMQTPAGMDTDHINGNKLDNRRSNLRVATRAQNNVNRGLTPNNTTGLKGVHAPEETIHGPVWLASIVVNDRGVHLGRYASPEDAGRAYDIAAAQHFGEYAQLNFPDRIHEPAPLRAKEARLPLAGTLTRRIYDALAADPEQLLTASEVAQFVDAKPELVNKLLNNLAKRGLAEKVTTSYPARFRFLGAA